MVISEWWRVDSAPTADEWQALAAMLTLLVALVGVVFALAQINQGSRQLKLSAEANARAAEAEVRAAEAAEAEARPYLSVRFDLRLMPPGDPKSQGRGGDGWIFVVIESTGRTPARDISLKAVPEFQSSGVGKASLGSDPALDALNFIFSGQPAIGMLSAGQPLAYLLDSANEALGPHSQLPQRYEVRATYWDAAHKHEYSESHILDLTPVSMSIASAKPIDVIARQMRRLNENLESQA